MKRILLAALLASTAGCAHAFTSGGVGALVPGAIYASPFGSGTTCSVASPCLYGAAQTKAQGQSVKTIYMRGGTYTSFAVSPEPADTGESWIAYPGETPVLDCGGGSTSIAFNADNGSNPAANNITIRWLTIQNCGADGIRGKFVGGWFVDSNTIHDIASSAEPKGGIIFVNGANNNVVTHNLIYNQGADGVGFAGATGSLVGNNIVAYNIIHDTCSVVFDCGSIADFDPDGLSSSLTIDHNVIYNTGPGTSGFATKAIYLDNYSSRVAVTNNIVYGASNFATQIHGGQFDQFHNNIFDISSMAGNGVSAPPLDRLQAPSYPSADPMLGNNFVCNIVYSTAALPTALWSPAAGSWTGSGAPLVFSNLYWGSGGTFPNGGDIVDSNPTVSNPNFVNPSIGNYAFASGTPTITGCVGGFIPINVSTAGPLPH